jgi:hypothetical protein
MSHPVLLPDPAQEGATCLDSPAGQTEVTRPGEPTGTRPKSRMIGPGRQVLSVEATTELLQLVEQEVDPERQSKVRFRELPHAD